MITNEGIRELHERFAPHGRALEVVWTHCEIVSRVAEQVVERLTGSGVAVDAGLVRAGSLLHDIGVYRLYGPDGELDHANYVRHGVLGHELLRGLGLPETLCRFCSCHTGVGLTRRDIVEQRLPLPEDDYVARTLEEQVVMYADKFHTKTDPPAFLTAASYTVTARRFGDDKTSIFGSLVARFGEPDVHGLSREYGHPVR